MSDNLVLERLREIRDILGGMQADMGDIKRRLTSLEMSVARVHGDFAGQSFRIDRIEQRLARIEGRIGLVDG
jgi:hypothetical protein